MRPAAQPRLKPSDGLRGLAALYVALHHGWLEIWLVGYRQRPTGVWLSLTGWLYYGHFAVVLFIVLSGFCLALPLCRTGAELPGCIRAFCFRRARRILPPFYAALGFSLLLIVLCIGKPTGSHWDAGLPVTGNGILAHLLLVQNVLQRGEINSVFWSIAVEWQIYLLFPVLAWLWKRAGLSLAVAAAIITSYGLMYWLRGTRIGAGNYDFVGLFALGMLAACLGTGEIDRDALLRIPWYALSALMAALVAYRCYGIGQPRIPDYFQQLDIGVGISVLCLLVAVCCYPKSLVSSALSCRPLVVLGSFSYSLYLIHFPLEQVVWQYCLHPLGLTRPLTFLGMVLIGIPMCLAGAYAFFWAVERRFVNKAPQ